MNRRHILLTGAKLGLVAATLPLWTRGAWAEGETTPDPVTGLFPDDRTLGNPEAKAMLIEYASLSCPHCAAFHANFLPKLKSDWIEQGKLFYVFRDFPLNAPALWGAMVANCLEGDRYFAFLDILFQNQSAWLGAEDPVAGLFQYAQLAGMDQARFDHCVNDQAELDRIIGRVEYAQETYDITGTPTIILNGEKVQPRDYEELSALIAERQG